jgi:hypothetical protein
LEFVEVTKGFSGWVWLAFLVILFLAVRRGSGLSPRRSFAASVILLVLLPVPVIAFVPLHLALPQWVEGAVLFFAQVAVGVTVVAYGFRAGLNRRVVVSILGAHLAMMLVGVMSSWV